MRYEHAWGQKFRFFVSLSAIYVLTIGVGWYALRPQSHHTRLVSVTKPLSQPVALQEPAIPTISGRPVRITIPASSIDLPVDAGYYNADDGSWTLSGYHAQFAMSSSPANNIAGNTFIYGHNNNYVFGALRHKTPDAGAEALLYTDNGHIFSYTFQQAHRVAPDDTSVLSYQGPPVLTIQTCTGSLEEWRTMFRFGFSRLVQ